MIGIVGAVFGVAVIASALAQSAAGATFTPQSANRTMQAIAGFEDMTPPDGGRLTRAP